MEIPKKNLGFNCYLPALGMALWKMRGDPQPASSWQHPLEQTASQQALKSGMNCLYTGGFQSGGVPEFLVGRTMRKWKEKRKDIFLAARVDLEYPRFNDTINSVIYTIRRLNCRYIDLCLVKFAHPQVDVSIAMRAMSALVRRGYVKHIGGVNLGEEQINVANFSSDYRLAANVLHYNLLERRQEDNGLIQFCRENGIFVVADRPFESGKLLHLKNKQVDEVCQKYGMTQAQLMLAWLHFQSHVITFTSMSRLEYLKEDMDSLNQKLSGEDFELLSREVRARHE